MAPHNYVIYNLTKFIVRLGYEKVREQMIPDENEVTIQLNSSEEVKYIINSFEAIGFWAYSEEEFEVAQHESGSI